MDWLRASFPIWIIGATVVYAIFGWMRTAKEVESVARHLLRDIKIRPWV